MRKSKEITKEEARYLFMKHISSLVDYWHKDTRETDPLRKLEGLAFSILSTIDGSSVGLPMYQLVPSPASEDDIQYAKEHGFDYYPKEPMDITDDQALHEIFYEYRRNEVERPENLFDFEAFLAEERTKF